MAIDFRTDYTPGLRAQMAERVANRMSERLQQPVTLEVNERGTFITVDTLDRDAVRAALRVCGGRLIYSDVVEGKLRCKFGVLVEGADS